MKAGTNDGATSTGMATKAIMLGTTSTKKATRAIALGTMSTKKAARATTGTITTTIIGVTTIGITTRGSTNITSGMNTTVTMTRVAAPRSDASLGTSMRAAAGGDPAVRYLLPVVGILTVVGRILPVV